MRLPTRLGLSAQNLSLTIPSGISLDRSTPAVAGET